MIRRLALAGVVLAAFGVAGWTVSRGPASLSAEALQALYDTPLSPPTEPLTVYHLGHSLVGRDMPAMLAQLAEHSYASQLGWGASLKSHWEPDVPINGFDRENAHDRYRDAKEAVGSGDYDAFVFTEMVEIEAAIAHFASATYVEKWAAAARDGNPDIRTYLYASWHALDDPNGWLDRLDTDPAAHWEGTLIAQAMVSLDADKPIYVIPAGRVMAEFVRRIETSQGVGGVTSREDLFARLEDGSLDPIHINDLGAYLVALTHYAVLYHRSPVGLPTDLERADGTQATVPSPELAALMQRTVWDVVSSLPVTGIAQN